MAGERTGRRFGALGSLTIAALVVMAGVAIVALVLIRDASTPFTGTGDATDSIFPDLDERIDEVATLAVAVDGNRLTFNRNADGRWTVAEKDEYPALSRNVDRLLDEFEQIRGLERTEADPGELEELGVPDSEADETGRRVQLLDGEGEMIKALIVGNRRSAPGATDLRAFYLREAGSDVVWLADADLEVSADPMEWLDPEILMLPREVIAEVRTQPEEGTPVHIRREMPEDSAFTGVNLPEDMELEGPWVLADLVVPFTAMTFEDVAAAEEPLESGGEGKGFARTFDGVKIWYSVSEAGEDEHWVRFAVEDVEPAPGWGPDADAEEEGEEPTRLTREAVVTADELGQRLNEWTFRVPAFTAERLRRSINELPTMGGATADLLEPGADSDLDPDDADDM